MAYYSARILICLYSYFICWSTVANGGNEASNGYRGRFGRKPEHYEVVIPTKVTETGKFISHMIPHHYKRSYYKTINRRDMGPEDLVHYALPIAGENHYLQLYPSNNIVSPGMVVEKHDNRGLAEREIRKFGNVQCHYSGSIKGQEDSKAALSTCYGLTGYVRTERGLFFIEPAAGHNPLSENRHPHLLYQHETDPPIFEQNCDTSGNLAKILAKRSCGAVCNKTEPEETPISVNALRPYEELYIETLIVLDKTILDYHKEVDIENYVLTVFNMAHNLYHDGTLMTNINLVIVRMIRLEEEEHELNLAINKDAKKTLEYFSNWQRKVNPADDSHPNHHDVAVLLTRIDLCGDENNCGLLGASVLGGICDPEHQAALCEDNGLRLGFVIAHEIGHTLAIPHDTLKESGCCAELPGGLSTVMNPSVDIRTAEWSSCSCKFLRLFIDQGLETCLYDPPTDHSFEMPDILPGVMYGADFQCRELLGPNSGLCSTGLECDNLICYIEGKGCIETRTAAAPGTSCDERKWCYRGQCLAIGERPCAVDGGWGPWSSWSECSRSCGSGVSSRQRICNNPAPIHGGKYCIGKHKSHKICNTEPCGLGKPTFRNVQCTEFNDWIYPEDGKQHTWSQYFMQDENPCILFCVNDCGDVAALQPRVIDGTKCLKGLRDICIDGLCQEIPCDFNLDSTAIDDWCGVCRGDGTSCTLKEGMTRVQECTDNEGLVKLLDIPATSVNIKLEEAEPSDVEIQIRNANGSLVYVAGDSLGIFDVPGSKAWFGNIRTRQSAINIPGPVTENLTIWVVALDNCVIKHSFGVKDTTKRKPCFDWDYIDWTKCSALCGPGTQESIPKCMEKVAGLVDDVHCINKTKPKEQIRPCEISPCIPRWLIGNWLPCQCPMGRRTRMVKCVKPTGEGEGESDIIADSNCVGPKPKQEESCVCLEGNYTKDKCENALKPEFSQNLCSKFSLVPEEPCENRTVQLHDLIIDKENPSDVVLVGHKECEEEFNYPTFKTTTVISGKDALRYLNKLEKDFSNNKTRV